MLYIEHESYSIFNGLYWQGIWMTMLILASYHYMGHMIMWYLEIGGMFQDCSNIPWEHTFAIYLENPFTKSPETVMIPEVAGWWFGTFFIFPYIGNNHPNWLIFFRGVQTTNQLWSRKLCRMYLSQSSRISWPIVLIDLALNHPISRCNMLIHAPMRPQTWGALAWFNQHKIMISWWFLGFRYY